MNKKLTLKKTLLISWILVMSFHCLKAQTPDPNFHIYLCFGQSNMEGQGPIETQDQTVDARFQVMGALTCSGNKNYTKGVWTNAKPGVFRCDTKIGPVDYFGREMVKKLPTNIKVGVVPVAVMGCDIALFEKAKYASYLTTAASYIQNTANLYGGNPYARLVEVAKLAQKDGVIKGILFHQGETNSGQSDWPGRVKGVYNNLITDLGLDPKSTPLLVGEVVTTAQGGVCGGHNSIIAKVPSVIPNSYVISASGLPAQSDNLHFTTASYRTFGIRYATQMLALLPTISNTSPSITITPPTTTTFVNSASVTITATTQAVSPNTIASVKFYQGTTLLATVTKAPYTYTFTSSTVGNYSITAVATDNAGNSTTSSAINISIINAYKIFKTPTPIVVDGTIDAIWNNSSVLPISATKLLSGAVTNTTDLSGTLKALWDDTYLYVLSDITDDTKMNDSPNAYDDDAVEVYLDVNNDKATTYGANDFQYTFGWNDGTTVGVLPSGHSNTSITYAAVSKTGGYIVETRIPWSTITATPVVNQIIGLDFMVNDDDDNGTRDGKLSWNSATDMAYQDPSLFGTAQLKEALVVTSLAESENFNNTIISPNPFTNLINVSIDGVFEYQLLNTMGEIIQSNSTTEKTILLNNDNLQNGLYLLKIIQNEQIRIFKIIKE